MKKFFESKLNIALLICLGTFIVFALLTYVWQYFVYASIFGLVGALVVGGIILLNYHNELKDSLHENYTELNEKEIKFYKRRLLLFKFYIAFMFLLALRVFWQLFSN